MLALIDAVVEEAKMVMDRPGRRRSSAPRSAGAVIWYRPMEDPDGVRNLRAAGKGELSRKGRTEAFHAVEVPVDQRGPVIARYREAAGRVAGPGVREAA